MTSGTNYQIHSRSADTDTQRLVEVAAKGLLPMFDQDSGLFCHRLVRTANGLVREGISPRYTIITLLGLHRLEEYGMVSPIRIYPVLEDLLANTEWIDNLGDLGLMLWLCASMAPERLVEVEKRLEVRNALGRYRDAKESRTMELAWFLSGLSDWSRVRPEKAPELRSLAFQTYRLLMGNYGGHGIFRHAAVNGSFSGRIRGWIGSFADQVYPICALTKFYKAYQEEPALERALKSATTLCEAQGPQGQWWWHYDSSSGRVVEGYPVFSVHQHGMGPMTLFEVGEAAGYDFAPWIRRGLQWIKSDNELALDMEDASANVIWRGIFRPGLARYWNAAFGLGTEFRKAKSRGELGILFECRPYELGWLLYALAGRTEALAQFGEDLDIPA